jgi:glycosyltransferase involved in cell wall biosynthesis
MSHSVNRILVIKMFFPMVKAISTRNINVTVFGVESGIDSRAEEGIIQSLSKNVKYVPMDFRGDKRIFNRLKYTRKLSSLIRQDKPDIVHVNALQDLFFTFVAVRFAALWKKRPAIIAMAHNPNVWSDPKRARLAVRTIRLFADGFVALATTNKNQLLSLGIPEDRLVVIPNPYDPDQIKPEDFPRNKSSSRVKKTLRIIYIANICERKAQDVLVRAAALVLKKHPDVDFDLVGKIIHGEEKYAEMVDGLARKLNIFDQVRFPGLVPYQEAMERLANSDIFVFPTLSEMMPRAVIEAMLAGKPIIASGVDGILDLIQNRKTGILVQPGNEEELADAICELIENPSLADALGSAGRGYILDYCSPERVGHLFLDFYKSIIDNVIDQFPEGT